MLIMSIAAVLVNGGCSADDDGPSATDPASPVPTDLCEWIGRAELSALVPDPKLSTTDLPTTDGPDQRSAACSARTADGGASLDVHLARHGGSGGEAYAQQAMEANCRGADTSAAKGATIPAGDLAGLGDRACGATRPLAERSTTVEVYVLREADVLRITHTRTGQPAATSAPVTALAKTLLDKL